MTDEEEPQSWVHQDEGTAPAPGEMELLRSFMSLHEHPFGMRNSQPPTRAAMRWWLSRTELVADGESLADEELDHALEVLEALRAKVAPHSEATLEPEAIETLDAAAESAGLRLRFDREGEGGIEPTAPGIAGAIGHVLAIAFLAEVDGRWAHLKHCGSQECRSVFYDRSKNHSGKWCSMQTCGNRSKVRAWRERQERR